MELIGNGIYIRVNIIDRIVNGTERVVDGVDRVVNRSDGADWT